MLPSCASHSYRILRQRPLLLRMTGLMTPLYGMEAAAPVRPFAPWGYITEHTSLVVQQLSPSVQLHVSSAHTLSSLLPFLSMILLNEILYYV